MPARPFIVAIDGPAGAGKSTASRQLAARLGFAMVDTGAIYRVGRARRGAPRDRARRRRRCWPSCSPRWRSASRRPASRAADSGCSSTARTCRWRSAPRPCRSARARSPPGRWCAPALLELQRRLALASQNRGAVLEGRDIGTVVFPDADAKFFLIATARGAGAAPARRARARAGDAASFEEVLADQLKRDRDDSSRAIAPLRPADDAVVVDTSGTPLEAVVEALAREVEARLGLPTRSPARPRTCRVARGSRERPRASLRPAASAGAAGCGAPSSRTSAAPSGRAC